MNILCVLSFTDIWYCWALPHKSVQNLFFVLVSFLSKDFNKVNLITEGGMPIKISSSLGHRVANDQEQSRWSRWRLILKIYCYNMSIFAYSASFFSWQQSQDSQVNITFWKTAQGKGVWGSKTYLQFIHLVLMLDWLPRLQTMNTS